jgi:hypothetical protein
VIPVFASLQGRLGPVCLFPFLVLLVRAVLEIIKIVWYHHCSLWVSLLGRLLALRVPLLEVAETVLSHGTRRRRREESKSIYYKSCVLL